jgi:putative salt-induced outer membrane protein YdiY
MGTPLILAQEVVTTNDVPATPSAPAPAPESTPPPAEPATTNVPAIPPQPQPTVTPLPSIRKPILGTSGAAMVSDFGAGAPGKFSVSGRTLRLPGSVPQPREETPWRRVLDFGMNMTQGNSDVLRYALGVDAVRDQDRDLFRLRARGVYGESDEEKDTENATATLRYERLLSREKVYALGNVDGLTDTIADLDYRVTGIASPGLHLTRTERTLVNLEAGAGYIQQKKAGEAESYAAGRLAASVERLLNAHVLAWFAVEYLPKLAEPSIYFVNAEIGVASAIARDLSLNITLQDRYDSLPPETKESNDLALMAALNLNF